MAKKTPTPVVDTTPTILTQTKEDFNKALDDRIEKGEELFNRQVTNQAATCRYITFRNKKYLS